MLSVMTAIGDDGGLRRWRLAAGLACLMFGLPSVAPAQTRAYCHITAIEKERLPNAVQLTIRADGLMATDVQSSHFFNTEASRAGQWERMGRRITEIPIRITNARSRVGSIANVGIYPVSHVEVTVPPDAPEGVGVNVNIVLYRSAVTREIRLPGDRWNFWGGNEPPPYISIEMGQDRRSVVVIVTSDRPTPTPERRRTPSDPEDRTLEVSASRGLVSIYALDADLRDLVRELSAVTGVSITAAADLERTVSMSLDSVALDDALDCIALTYGASVSRTGQTVHLADASIAAMADYRASEIAEIPLRHLSPEAIRNSLPDVLLGHVRINGGRNSITVSGSAAIIEKVREDVAKLDKPIPMIEVCATAVDFDDSEDLNAVIRGRLAWQGGLAAAGTDLGDITYSSIGPDTPDLQVLLSALIARGRARVRSEMRSVVLNGETARLFVGREQRIAAQFYDFWSEDLTTRIMTLSVGTSLEVTPWTAGKGSVTAAVRAEVSTIASRERGTGNPTVAQRMTDTTIRLSDGETLYIGGLDVDQQGGVDRSVLLGGIRIPRTRGASASRFGVFVTMRTLPGSTTARDGASAHHKG